jgi:hypothetical protein
MKLYAQHGHAPSDKMLKAIERGFIDGVILSPRYIIPGSTNQLIIDLKGRNSEIDIFIDPEFYATRYEGNPNAQLGYLEEWDHFRLRRQNDLLLGTSTVDECIRDAFVIQLESGCTNLIAPNIYISNSFDSIEAAIAISFMNRTKIITNEMSVDKPVFATLSVSRDAIIDRSKYVNFLNAVTALDSQPEGIYLLVGAGPTDERIAATRSEIMNANVIARWMLFNYSLSLNGLLVVNAFSDVLTPFLGVAGGYAGSTGWWSNLQVFSMGRYIRIVGGGQLPILRYLSKKLFNRITISERHAFSEVIPGIMNELSTDSPYLVGEPSRTEEALQTWQTISSICNDLRSSNIGENLQNLQNCVDDAETNYTALLESGFSDRFEANMEYLSALKESIIAFKELAELP